MQCDRLTKGALEERDDDFVMDVTDFISMVMSVPDVRLSVSDVHLIDQSVAGEFLDFSL